MDSISGSRALSTAVDSSTRNGVKTFPKREFKKIYQVYIFPKRGRQKPRSPPHSTPLLLHAFHLHFTRPRLSIPPPATVFQSITYASAIRSVCVFVPWTYCSAMAKSNKRNCRNADDDTSATQRAPSRQSPKYRGCGAWVRCYAGTLCEECTRVYRLRLRTERVTKAKARPAPQRAPVRSAKSLPLTRLRLRTVRVNTAKARPAARRELPIRCKRELSVLAVWPIYIHRSQYCTSRQYQV